MSENRLSDIERDYSTIEELAKVQRMDNSNVFGAKADDTYKVDSILNSSAAELIETKVKPTTKSS